MTAMVSYCARLHQEFDLLVQRASRVGRLHPLELLDTYREIAPQGHPGLGNPRRVDIDTLVQVLGWLPAAVFNAPRILVAPSLDKFHYELETAAPFRSGLLGDGSLMVEAAEGSTSLLRLAFCLCAVEVERSKAQELLQAVPGLLDDLWRALDPQPAAENAAADPQDPDQAHEDPPDLDTQLARLAFELGLDESQLRHADAQTDGVVWQVLLGEQPIGPLQVHADLHPRRQHDMHHELGRQVTASIAEAGFLGRPLHIWVGPPVLTQCLSPYTRDLYSTLLQWAEQHPHLLGRDIQQRAPSPGEDVMYALANDFLRTDDNLHVERQNAERTVGITSFVCGELHYELIDLNRVDVAAADSRLAGFQLSGEQTAPVLLRLSPLASDTQGCVLRSVVESIGASTASVTLVLEGSGAQLGAGAIVVPEQLIPWNGSQRYTLQGLPGLDSAAILGYSEKPVHQGRVLCAPFEQVLSPQLVQEIGGQQTFTAQLGEHGSVVGLFEAFWSGVLPAPTPVTCAIVTTEYVDTERPTVQTLNAQAAVAIARLRQLPGTHAPRPRRQVAQDIPVEEPPRPRTPSRAALAMRIKA